MTGLKIQPKLRRRAEGLRQHPGRFGSHSPLPSNEFVDALNGNTKMSSKRHLRDAERLQVFFEPLPFPMLEAFRIAGYEADEVERRFGALFSASVAPRLRTAGSPPASTVS